MSLKWHCGKKHVTLQYVTYVCTIRALLAAKTINSLTFSIRNALTGSAGCCWNVDILRSFELYPPVFQEPSSHTESDYHHQKQTWGHLGTKFIEWLSLSLSLSICLMSYHQPSTSRWSICSWILRTWRSASDCKSCIKRSISATCTCQLQGSNQSYEYDYL